MGETPPYSPDAYKVFGDYYSLFEQWQQTNSPQHREELCGEMAELDATVAPVALAEAGSDVFAEAYVVGHALTAALSNTAGGRQKGEDVSITNVDQELEGREASEQDQAKVSGLLLDSVREVLPVSEGGDFDLEVVSFLPQFAPRHLRRVAEQIPSLRRRLTDAGHLDLNTALVATITHHAPDLLERRNRKHLPRLTAEWLESDEAQATVTEVLENKIRTNDDSTKSNKRRTVVTTRMPKRNTT